MKFRFQVTRRGSVVAEFRMFDDARRFAEVQGDVEIQSIKSEAEGGRPSPAWVRGFVDALEFDKKLEKATRPFGCSMSISELYRRLGLAMFTPSTFGPFTEAEIADLRRRVEALEAAASDTPSADGLDAPNHLRLTAYEWGLIANALDSVSVYSNQPAANAFVRRRARERAKLGRPS